MPTDDLSPPLLEPGAPNPDDEATDLSLVSLAAVLPPNHPTSAIPLEGTPAPASPEPAAGGELEEAKEWHFNALSAVLVTALCCTLLVAVALLLKLVHTRSVLHELENTPEVASVAAAKPPPAPPIAKPESEGVNSNHPPPEAKAPEQLLLLLTVGKEHYARKQLLRLRELCSAPLAIYRQTRGRCAWDECFVVATAAANAEAARGCGQGKGDTLRDRQDFAAP